MPSPFVDSASFLSHGSGHATRIPRERHGWLVLALVMAVAASSAVLLAF